MFKAILKTWSNRPLSTILIAIGYTIGISVATFGISYIQNTYQDMLDSTSGDPAHYRSIKIDKKSDSSLDLHTFLDYINKAATTAEIQFGFREVDVEGNHESVVGVIFNQKPEWTYPMMNGSYFTAEQTISDDKIAVIGKEVARLFFPEGFQPNQSISINGQPFEVIGVIGRKGKARQWDDAIYVPLGATKDFDDIFKNQENISLFMRTNGYAPIEESKAFVRFIENHHPKVDIEIDPPMDESLGMESVTNHIASTTLFSGLILFVTIINVVNLSLFWILDRKKEIGIRIVLGATKHNVVKQIFMEMITIAMVGAFIALCIQLILFYNIPLLKIYKVSYLNFVISFIIAILIGSITAIAPIMKVMKYEPSTILKNL